MSTLVTVIDDYRTRYNGEPLAGDRCTLSDGSPGIIYMCCQSGDKQYFFCAPEELVDRRSYLESRTDSVSCLGSRTSSSENLSIVYPKWWINHGYQTD